MKFNINKTVSFILTAHGAEVAQKDNDEIAEHLPTLRKTFKAGDVYTGQLRNVMKIFGGDNSGLGKASFCYCSEIEIKESESK